jgi:hypothetical protein
VGEHLLILRREGRGGGALWWGRVYGKFLGLTVKNTMPGSSVYVNVVFVGSGKENKPPRAQKKAKPPQS